MINEPESMSPRVEALIDMLRDLNWEDVADLVLRRKLSPADRLFRSLEDFAVDEFAADEFAAPHPRSKEERGSPRDLPDPRGT